jgi:hypothetical protein
MKISTCQEKHMKDLVKRRKSGRSKADADNKRMRGGMLSGPAPLLISQLQQNNLYFMHSELKSTKWWVVLQEIWSGIRRHPYIISICSLGWVFLVWGNFKLIF